MSNNNCPGLYFDIGKKAKDLLYKDYAHDQPPTYFHYQYLKWNFDLSCETQEILPGLTTLFRFIIPDSCKVELRFLQDYVGITAGVGLKSCEQGSFKGSGYDPFVNFSGVIGSTLLSLGAEIAFDISTREIDYFSASWSFKNAFIATSLALEDKFDTIRASCFHAFNPLTRTAIAAELRHSFSSNEMPTLAIGAQHALFPFILMKARVNSEAKAGALIQLELWQKILFGVGGEVDFRSSNRISKAGVSLALKP